MSITLLSNSWKQHSNILPTDEAGNKNLEVFLEALKAGKSVNEKIVALVGKKDILDIHACIEI